VFERMRAMNGKHEPQDDSSSTVPPKIEHGGLLNNYIVFAHFQSREDTRFKILSSG